MLASAQWRTVSWRSGTKGRLKARFAAVRVRTADGPPQRIWDKGQQHLPGDEAWLIGEHRASGEKKYYLANLAAGMDLRSLAATIKARWICEQAHQQLKEELGLDHFEGRSWHGLHRHALMAMIAYAFLQHRRLTKVRRGKRINGPPPQPTLPAVRHAIVDLIMRSGPQRCPYCRSCISAEKQRESICQSSARSVALEAKAQSGDDETWPTKTLRAIVPYGAGSTTDIVPRVVFDQLSSQFGQTIIVENRPGAGGTIGSAFVAEANPDGYTLLVNSAAHAISPALYPHLSYDPARDFAAVIPLGVSPNVLVVSPSKGFKTVGDLVAAAKAKPGALTFSSVGVGTATHLSAERFRASAGIEVVHVPFKGGAEAMTEVMAGRVDFFFGPVGLVLPLVRQGKLTALVVNSAKRSAALPDVPTTQEAGFADAEYPIWFGLFLPAKTPRDIVDKLHDETLKALQAPKVRDKLATLGVDPMVMTPKEFDAFVRKEIAVNAALVKAADVKTN